MGGIAAYAFLVLSAVACSRSGFSVQPLSAQNVRTSSNNSDPTAPRTTSFNVIACLTDATHESHSPVHDEVFTVKGGTQSIDVSTDAKGCFSWPESVTFNYLANESYIKFTRVIEGRGGFQGKVEVPFALNPWKLSSDSFVDLRSNPIDAEDELHPRLQSKILKEAEANQSGSAQAQLFFKEMSIQTEDPQMNSGQMSLLARLSMKPELTRITLEQSESRESITKGKFKLELSLYEVPRGVGKGQEALLDQKTVDATVESGVISSQIRFELKRVPHPESRALLRIKATFVSSGALKSQESELHLDSFLVHGTFPLQKASIGGSIAYVQAEADDEPQKSEDGPGYQYDRFTVEFGGVVNTLPHSSVPSSVMNKFTLCLKDSIQFRPVVKHPFLIFNEEKTTDALGCIYFQRAMDFDYYTAEKWIQSEVSVRSVTAPYAQGELKIPYFVNPWRTGASYFWDSRQGTPPLLKKQNAQGSSLVLKEIHFQYLKRTFQKGSDQKLEISRHYQIRLRPMMLRRSEYGAESRLEPIQEGRLLIEGSVMNQGLPLSHFSTDGEVNEGELIADISMPYEMNHLETFNQRGLLVLKVSQIEPTSSLLPQTFEGPFSGGPKELTVALTSSKVTDLKLPKSSSPRVLFSGDLASISSPQVAVRFCKLVYLAATQIKSCEAAPLDYLRMTAGESKLATFSSVKEISNELTMMDSRRSEQWSESESQESFENQGKKVSTFDRSSAKKFKKDFLKSSNRNTQREITSRKVSKNYHRQFSREFAKKSNRKTWKTNAKGYVRTEASAGFELFGDGFKASAGGELSRERSSEDGEETGTEGGNDHGTEESDETGRDQTVESGKEKGIDAGTETSTEKGMITSQDGFKGTSHGSAQSIGQGLTQSVIQSLVVEKIQIESKVNQGKCVNVSASVETTGGAIRSNVIQVCDDSTQGSFQITQTEEWFYVHPLYSNAILIDASEEGASHFFKIIQGKAAFIQFRKEFQKIKKQLRAASAH